MYVLCELWDLFVLGFYLVKLNIKSQLILTKILQCDLYMWMTLNYNFITFDLVSHKKVTMIIH